MNIAIGKNQAVWIKKQTVKGTAVWPAAADAVLISGEAKFDQDRSFYDDKQKRLTLGKLGRIAGLYKPGEFVLAGYIKPSGSLGVAPVPGKLLESLMGVETVVGSTSVAYSLYDIDDEPVYLTVLVKDNFETWLISDLVVTKMSLPIVASDSDAAIVEGTFSGNFLKSLLAGTDATSQLETIGETDIHVVDARKFEVGQKIIIGTSGVTSGHLITAVTIATNIVTIAAAGLESEQASGVVVKGWTPAITEAGYLMHGRFGKYQEQISGGSYADVLITQAVLEVNNGWKVLNDEKTDNDYATDFAPGDRDISVKLSRYFRADGAAYRYEVNNQTVKLIKLQAAVAAYSSSSGKRMEITAPNQQQDPPSKSGEAERKYEVTCHNFETAALNDALVITFA
jgi:hypothetical protein